MVDGMTVPKSIAVLTIAALVTLRAVLGVGLAAPGWDDERIHLALEDEQARAELEEKLLALIASDANFPEKRGACRELRRVASDKSVPVLARLLADPKLTHMARFVLQQMSSAAAGDALRAAAPRLKGAPLVGVLDSLGERGGPASIPVLTRFASDKDEQVMAAALRALGKVGGQKAADALAGIACPSGRRAKAAWADAQIDCAGRLRKEGRHEAAAAIYARLGTSEIPASVRPAVIRGLLLTCADGRDKLLEEAFNDGDAVIRAVAGRFIAGAAPESEVKALIKRVNSLGAGGQVMLIRALAQRGYEPARKTVTKLARSESEPVRIASLRALARLGTEDDVRLLVELGSGGPGGQQKAARMTLATLRGEDVEDEMISLLRKSDPPAQLLLIHVLAERSAASAAKALIKLASKAEGEVKSEAVKALGRVLRADRVSAVVDMVRGAPTEADLRAAVGALRQVCTRVDPKARSELTKPILAGLNKAEGTPRRELLLLLPMLADAHALAAARAELKSDDQQNHDAALRALSSWPNSAPAADLLAIAEKGSDKQRAVAFRGYTRLIDRERSDKRMAMCRRAAALAKRRDDKKLLLSSLGRVHNIDALRMASGYLEDAEVREEACAATIRIASRLPAQHKNDVVKVMQRVVALTKNRRHKRQAQEVLKR